MYDPNNYPDNGNEGGSDLLPVGKHIVTVFDHELGKTSGGYGQMIVNFKAKDGRTRKAWLIYEGKAGFQLAGLLRAVGHNEKLDLESGVAVRRAIYGKPVQIVIEEETYNGETKPKVKWINKAPAGSVVNGSARDEDPGPGDAEIPF